VGKLKAIDDERMLVAFGVTPGSKVNATIDAAAGLEGDAKGFSRGNDGAYGIWLYPYWRYHESSLCPC
jgi:hypothetical protein